MGEIAVKLEEITNLPEKLHRDVSFSNLIDIQEEEPEIITMDENAAPFCMDETVRTTLPLIEREKAIDDTLEWLRKQMTFLKDQDQNLMRKFLKIRTLLNTLQQRGPRGRKVSLPEDAIAAYSLRRFSETSEQQVLDMRKRSQSVFGEGISKYVTSLPTPQSSMEELSED
ncbi:uncharacterized protein LOC116288813 [Actinia tenebrosa]|uniref:Uncharacterized protein LOC116288813 n=1 Tax=Actinia tenebrosa TaxID=6105 RepID=A0A6P8HG00_ACTTE|nr:uncharacterized protein LOC116288813 [Actinia tenebrosa]